GLYAQTGHTGAASGSVGLCFPSKCCNRAPSSAGECFPSLLERGGAVIHPRLQVLLLCVSNAIRSRRQSVAHEEIRFAPRPGGSSFALALQTGQLEGQSLHRRGTPRRTWPRVNRKSSGWFEEAWQAGFRMLPPAMFSVHLAGLAWSFAKQHEYF